MMFEKYHHQIELHLDLMIGSFNTPRVLKELSQDDDFHINLRLIALTINSIVGRHYHLHDDLFQACPEVDSDTDLRFLMLELFDLLDKSVNYDILMRNHSSFTRFIRTPFCMMELNIKNGAIKSLRSIWIE